MFSSFYEFVFPALGNAFGILSTYASLPFARAIHYFCGFSGDIIYFNNYFTGLVTFLPNIPEGSPFIILGGLLEIALTPIIELYSLFFPGFRSEPLWVGVLSLVFTFGLMVILIRGIFKLISGWF